MAQNDLPPIPYKTPMLTPDGLLTLPWSTWFRQIFSRVGGNTTTILLNVMSAVGDSLYGGIGGATVRMAGNTTTTKKFKSQTGDGAASAAPIWSQVAFSDLTGSATGAQLPDPSASTLGGVQSIAAVAKKFLTSISTSGVPTLAQPASTDLSDVSFGTYTPTLANVANTTAQTPYVWSYLKVGNTVTVSVRFDANTTAAANTLSAITASLPVASNFTLKEDAGGSFGIDNASGVQVGGMVYGKASSQLVYVGWSSAIVGNNGYFGSFSYQVKP